MQISYWNTRRVGMGGGGGGEGGANRNHCNPPWAENEVRLERAEDELTPERKERQR